MYGLYLLIFLANPLRKITYSRKNTSHSDKIEILSSWDIVNAFSTMWGPTKQSLHNLLHWYRLAYHLDEQ